MRRNSDGSSSSCDNEEDTCGEEMMKRERLDSSSSFSEDELGTPGGASTKRQRADDSLSSSEEIEDEKDNESVKRQRQNDSHSSCEDIEDESGRAKQAQINVGKRQQSRWDSMFTRLIAFKEKHGHCLVPNRFEKDRSLGAWVSTQRRHYKVMMSKDFDHTSTPLTTERIQKLNDVGFAWASSDPRHTPWDVRFNELRAYREQFGRSTQRP
jgi:hypothetical protein